MGRPKTPKDLLSHKCLVTRVGESEVYDHWEFEHGGKDIEVKVRGPIVTNDPAVKTQFAIDGAGLIYYPEALVANLIKERALEIVLDKYAAASDGFYLYYPKRSQMMPKLRVFVDHLIERGLARKQGVAKRANEIKSR